MSLLILTSQTQHKFLGPKCKLLKFQLCAHCKIFYFIVLLSEVMFVDLVARTNQKYFTRTFYFEQTPRHHTRMVFIVWYDSILAVWHSLI